MLRKIIEIDEEKCNGCGLCINACHEGALKLIDGKAKLTSESYCDGLGDCLPECPTGAINIVEKECAEYDEEAVKVKMEKEASCSCVGCANVEIDQKETNSQLKQWPCQIKLMAVNSPHLRNADILIAADCTAFSYANIHNDFMKGRVTLVGCTKLDSYDYSEKFTDILQNNKINSITVLKMDVPCCGGMSYAVKKALDNTKSKIPCKVITINMKGEVIREEEI